ncbi:methionyl-tRNA formyltransferase [Nostocoides sp. F2B08]|uniref:methionyl-tRNA formyltransferase n=1 Tax=Nostocoides sp. F2B08 TaxID=2653936 RepID=UPI001262F95B|nr:methionyl-tRNA formyltransferase [Tetrasphaera sp. F2B08]KAB7744590.1 methionyl-tRNA formyltransferase [Tetrasphaera sp. F2B08]
MRVVFAGTPEVAIPSLRVIVGSGHRLLAVVTRPDARAGRGRAVQPSPVRTAASDLGVPVLTPDHPRDTTFQQTLRELRPDVCAVVAYGALLPPAVLEIPALGWINLHFSLLPAWRGAAPVQHAILAGDELTGATTFRIEAGLDTGPVLGRMTERIGPRDTAGELLDRLATAGAPLLLATLDALADGSAVPVDQPAEGVSHAPKLGTEDAMVRWGDPAFAVDRRVRACTPAPGAWTTFRESRLGVGPVEPVTDADSLGPGEIRAQKREILVGTASGAVRLGTVRPVGRREMPAADWARGVRIEAGERLG